jgi:alcohol dehydrogenase (cytochrome c)
VFFKNATIEDPEYVEGQRFMGSASMPTNEPIHAGIRALDPVTGEVAWEYLRQRPQRDVGRIGGVLSSAGNLVFFGDMKEFVAFDATLGRELWRVNLGGHINASPVSFAIDGQQRVAIPAGNTVYVFRP